LTDATSYRWEDDYADLHVDDSTYADFDWDDVPAAVVNRHDTLLTMETAALAAVAFEGEDAILRWAAARRWLALNETKRFIEAVEALLAAQPDSPSAWLSYSDIRLELGRVVARIDVTAAMGHFDEYEKAADHSPTEAARYRGLADIAFGDPRRGTETLVAAVKAHSAAEPELASTIAENLLDQGATDAAKDVLTAGIAAAQAQDDPGLARELGDLLRLTSEGS
jgi:hypothetical protein